MSAAAAECSRALRAQLPAKAPKEPLREHPLCLSDLRTLPVTPEQPGDADWRLSLGASMSSPWLRFRRSTADLLRRICVSNPEMYRKKDFPHGLGMADLSVLASLATVVTYWLYHQWVTWSILVGTCTVRWPVVPVGRRCGCLLPLQCSFPRLPVQSRAWAARVDRRGAHYQQERIRREQGDADREEIADRGHVDETSHSVSRIRDDPQGTPSRGTSSSTISVAFSIPHRRQHAFQVGPLGIVLAAR